MYILSLTLLNISDRPSVYCNRIIFFINHECCKILCLYKLYFGSWNCIVSPSVLVLLFNCSSHPFQRAHPLYNNLKYHIEIIYSIRLSGVYGRRAYVHTNISYKLKH